MAEVKFWGITLDDAIKALKKESEKTGEVTFGEFNGETLYSTDTIDEAYEKVTGKTKAEFDEIQRKWKEDYDRSEAEHKAKIPALTEEYKKLARGVILEEKYDYWDKIVPIRLEDIYHGMELGATLDLCKIMRDESMTYDKRLKKAYDLFMDQGHSGWSAGLVASMLREFCPDGYDLADAVMNFRFEQKKEKV